MFNFLKIAAVSPKIIVGDCTYNTEIIVSEIMKHEGKASYIVFPELSITGYTCADLFFQNTLLTSAKENLKRILKETQYTNILVCVGMPLKYRNSLYNVAIVMQSGKILGIVPKSYLPNYNEFYESRWFESGLGINDTIDIFGSKVPFSPNTIFTVRDKEEYSFAIELCEDLWAVIPPSSYHVKYGAHMIFNLSASNELVAKYEYRRNLIANQSARGICGYVYSSANANESSTDLVYGGHNIIAENGRILVEGERFSFDTTSIIAEIDVEKIAHDRIQNSVYMKGLEEKQYNYIEYNYCEIENKELSRFIDKHPFVPADDANRNKRCKEIFNIQCSGLAKRIMHIGCQKVVIGVSGGLDSTLALLVCVKAFKKLGYNRKNIVAVTMPGFGTTNRTYKNAVKLIELLGVTFSEISIKEATLLHFKDIGHDKDIHDLTYENSQARERYQILMDVACKEDGIVVGTGDLSEIALGFCTYNGDHMSMYSVNCSVPKTLIKYLIKYVSDNEDNKDTKELLLNIMDTPISPELLPPKDGKISQITEDILGPYEVHDFYLYNMIRNGFSKDKLFFLAKIAFRDKYTDEELEKWLLTFIKRFFTQQYKRSCTPDGPKVGSINLSPRGDWRMPSDASYMDWIKE